MSKPEDIPQDVWDMGAKLAGEYLAWLNAGNSTGHLSEHAVAAMADTIDRAILAAKAEERGDIWAIAVGNAVGERELERMAREAGDAEGCLLHALLARENEQLAAAIRKRGEG